MLYGKRGGVCFGEAKKYVWRALSGSGELQVLLAGAKSNGAENSYCGRVLRWMQCLEREKITENRILDDDGRLFDQGNWVGEDDLMGAHFG